MTRGLLTALILLTIIALWAAVFLFGLNKVFAGDPLTKAAPASFFAATQTATGGTAPTTAGSATGTSGVPVGARDRGDRHRVAQRRHRRHRHSHRRAARDRAAPDRAPAVARPPRGTPGGRAAEGRDHPAGLGGAIAGTVTAKSSGEPVGRIIVAALRVRADGTTVAEASAATQADGTYQVAGLFPADYVLRFSADGFVTSYFPAATEREGGDPGPGDVRAGDGGHQRHRDR